MSFAHDNYFHDILLHMFYSIFPTLFTANYNTFGRSFLLQKAHHLFLIDCRPKRPYAREREVQFVPLLRAVRRRVGWHQEAFEQMAQHLYVRHLRDWYDLLKPVADILQTRRNVLVEQNDEVALLDGVFSRFDPTRHVSVQQVHGYYIALSKAFVQSL